MSNEKIVVPATNPSDIERRIRAILAKYWVARSQGDLKDVVFGLHTALEEAFDEIIGEDFRDLSFNQKTERVLPDLYKRFNVEDLTRARNHFAHPKRLFKDEEVQSTASGFVNLTILAWPRLFSTSIPTISQPPNISNGATGGGTSPPLLKVNDNPRRMAKSDPRQSAGGATWATRPWWSLIFAMVLLGPVLLLAGFLQGATSSKPQLPWYLLLLPFGLFLLFCFYLLRSLLRFWRGAGTGRLLGIMAIGLLAIVLVLAQRSPAGDDWKSNISQGLYQILNLAGRTTRDAAVGTFSTGEDIASEVLPKILTPVPLETQTSGENDSQPLQSGITTVAGSRSVPDDQFSPYTPGASPSEGNLSIHIGGQVRVRTNGTRLRGRDLPGLDSNITVYFPFGTQLTVSGGPIEKDGYTWWRVKGEEGEGWSAADFLTLIQE